MSMTTEYRDIEGFPGYRIGSDGSVWSCRSPNGRGPLKNEWRRLSVGTNRGYLQVTLSRNGRRYCRLVHLLVLSAFRGQCPHGMEGCHEDGNRDNSALSNLRWDTRSNNHSDKHRHGTALIGEKNPRAKLTADAVRAIRVLARQGCPVLRLSRRFGVSRPVISDIIHGRKWKHVEECMGR